MVMQKCSILIYNALYNVLNRAIRTHIHGRAFHCRERVNKKTLQTAARRIFERVRTQTILAEAEQEAKLWDWLLRNEKLGFTSTSIDCDLNIEESLLTRNKCLSDDVPAVVDLTEDEDGDDIEPDVLIVDGRVTMNQDVSSGIGSWILYANAATFLELRKEVVKDSDEHSIVRYQLHIPYLHMRFTVTPDAEQRFRNPLYSPELKQYFARQ